MDPNGDHGAAIKGQTSKMYVLKGFLFYQIIFLPFFN